MSVGVRSGGIDLIRAVSILVVLLHHFNIAYDLPDTALGRLLSPGLVHAICRNGNYGVTMFFTISGFLITSNTLARWGRLRDVGLAGFYARRAARIVPCLILLLAVVTTLGVAGIPMFMNQPESGPPVSFLQADLAALTFRINGLMQQAGWFNYCLCALWSLSVEEVFYLAFPLLCVTLRRDILLAAFALALVLVGPAYRAAHQDDEARFLYGYLACFDGIAIGCVAALLARAGSGRVLRGQWPGRIVAAAMTAFYLWRSVDSTNVWGVTAMSMGTAILLIRSWDPGRSTTSPGRVRSGLEWIGRHSYELYLFHLVVLATMRTILPPHRIVAQAVLPWLGLYLLGSLGLAFLVGRLVAEPADREIRRVLLQ